mmetsp:Transcript_14807/g.48514  ORF Transcript_14807/g.48514 Transcript_14807/m.48514 type:complete len:209 (+) Transcript_14807:231-857(+)
MVWCARRLVASHSRKRRTHSVPSIPPGMTISQKHTVKSRIFSFSSPSSPLRAVTTSTFSLCKTRVYCKRMLSRSSMSRTLGASCSSSSLGSSFDGPSIRDSCCATGVSAVGVHAPSCCGCNEVGEGSPGEPGIFAMPPTDAGVSLLSTKPPSVLSPRARRDEERDNADVWRPSSFRRFGVAPGLSGSSRSETPRMLLTDWFSRREPEL